MMAGFRHHSPFRNAAHLELSGGASSTAALILDAVFRFLPVIYQPPMRKDQVHPAVECRLEV